jgi:hypothetical protein
MAGYLDSEAPSEYSEYSRYLDGDLLGKYLFKNFCTNYLGLQDADIHVPRGRSPRYDPRRISSDAQVMINRRWLNVEIKCSRLNLAHPWEKTPLECWSFGPMLRAPKGRPKPRCDLAFLVGVRTRGIADPEYWKHLKCLVKELQRFDGDLNLSTLPHEPEFLNLCGFLIIPASVMFANNVNNISLTTRKLSRCKFQAFFAWGYDRRQCLLRWHAALRAISRSPRISRMETPQLELITAGESDSQNVAGI